MKLYLIRHGETEWNKKRLLQGQVDIPLNENGVSVAKMTGEGLRSTTFDVVFSSPLKRAYETAQLVTEGRCKIQTDDRLKEMAFGPLEGCDLKNKTYDAIDPTFQYFFTEPERYVAPKGAETIEDLCERTGAFVNELIQNPEFEDRTILVVTHGGALRGLMMSVLEKPVSQFWEGGVHRNCAVTILDVTEGKITVEQQNVIYYDEALSTNLV